MMRHMLYFDWLLAKRQITKFDTMRNTGEWKSVANEIVMLLPMPYPFFNKYVFYQYYNEIRFEFKINYILLTVMTFARIH